MRSTKSSRVLPREEKRFRGGNDDAAELVRKPSLAKKKKTEEGRSTNEA